MPAGVLLFDGNCELCARSVRFLIRRDPAGRLAYAALGSQPARRLLAAHGRPEDEADSVVLLENSRIFDHSTAVFRSLARLRWPWPLAAALLLVPRFLRDAGYDYVSRHRRAWFGRCTTCPVLRSLAPERFLDH